MQKANQQQVIQNANINVVAIRTIEITYFSTFFGNFGTVSALLVGLIIQNVSQIPIVGDTYTNPFWMYLYCICTAISFITAVHVLMCSVFVSVYGQGLALRGPVGSMVKAVDGITFIFFTAYYIKYLYHY
jgi:hypothetical protein